MPNAGPRFSTGREPVGTHEFTAKYDAKSAQPMNLANEPNSFPAACRQAASIAVETWITFYVSLINHFNPGSQYSGTISI